MNTKTGILALGLFTITGVVTISCGGSSDESNNPGSSGSSTTAGSSSAGNSTGGSSSAGTTNNTAGTTNNTGGTNNNTAGNTSGGTMNAGGDNTGPIFGGGGDGATGCPATQPADGTACMRGDGGFLGCSYGDQVCRCTRQGQQMRSWTCDPANPGAGGDNGGFGTATCPDNAMNGDDCTGFGQCPNQQGCFCGGGNVFCQ